MKKIVLEIVVSAALVFVPTLLVYRRLAGIDSFWNAQFLWSAALALCWLVVAAGYYHQGWLVRLKKRTEDVSVMLPIAVFFVQCILFVKGVFYGDWSLIWGAVIVNSGVVFSLFQIVKVRGSFFGNRLD